MRCKSFVLAALVVSFVLCGKLVAQDVSFRLIDDEPSFALIDESPSFATVSRCLCDKCKCADCEGDCQAPKRRNVPKFYTRADCVFCPAVKRFLIENNVDFDTISDAEGTVPRVEWDGVTVTGWHEDRLRWLLGRPKAVAQTNPVAVQPVISGYSSMGASSCASCQRGAIKRR